MKVYGGVSVYIHIVLTSTLAVSTSLHEKLIINQVISKIPAFSRDLQASLQVKVKVKVTLRLTVSQSVCLDVEPNYGTFDHRFFFLKATVLSFMGRPL
jgi:hypothetical protein